MKNRELQELLKQFPDDMEVWISDKGYCEGGERLTKVEKVIAILSKDGKVLSKEIIFLNDN